MCLDVFKNLKFLFNNGKIPAFNKSFVQEGTGNHRTEPQKYLWVKVKTMKQSFNQLYKASNLLY